MKLFARPRLWLLLIMLPVFAGLLLAAHRAVDGWGRYRPMATAQLAGDRRVSAAFLASGAPESARYDQLFLYFLHGFVANASPGFARINYPGLPSEFGYAVSGLEGFARTAPLLAAWLHSGRNPRPLDPQTGQPVDIARILHDGILNGTAPASPEYWGRMGSNDQRMVEAADVAVALWIARDEVWRAFSPDERRQVARWLQQAYLVPETYDNNHKLFPVTVTAFLKAVGYNPAADYSAYYSLKRHYQESGWYFDVPHGVDFYNTWGYAYSLYWIHQMDPSLDGDFIKQVLVASAGLTTHLISPAGIPVMGRSLCYRGAISVPVIAASYLPGSGISPGIARRSLDATWNYFVANGILQEGTVTQGYLKNDIRFADTYIGPGSCHWSLRSLAFAYLSPPEADFWTVPVQPLPVEVADFHLSLPRLDWEVAGQKASGEITVTIGRNTATALPILPYGPMEKLEEFLTRRPHRKENFAVEYGLHQYSALHPFTNSAP